jgi:TrmH family RNA methyltransferase
MNNPGQASPAPGGSKRITSLTNSSIKEIRGLWLGKNRKASGLFLAEGLKLITDAVASGWQLSKLVHADDATIGTRLEHAANACREAGGDVLTVSKAVLAKISRRDNPQTVIGVFRQNLTPMDQIRPDAQAVWVALESVRDPGNLGTIIRTVDAVGAAGVILVGSTVDPFSVEAVRATMGSIFHVPLARADHAEFASLASAWTGAIAGTHLDGAIDYREADYRQPCLLIMGAEQAGMSAEITALCNTVVKIPMAGRADSLNLAVATGVMLFEIQRGALALDV